MRNPELTQYYLQQMGIDTWLLRNKTMATNPILPLDSRENQNAKVMIIADFSDEGGCLFSGKAEMLLKNMLKSIHLTKQNVYLTTMLRNDSLKDSADLLYKEIAQASPEIIIVVGDAASQCLLGAGVAQHTIQYYQSIPVVNSIHPADLLQNPSAKKQVYADLLLIKQLLMCNA
jgi:uracil-DNA glycosylase family 4